MLLGRSTEEAKIDDERNENLETKVLTLSREQGMGFNQSQIKAQTVHPCNRGKDRSEVR